MTLTQEGHSVSTVSKSMYDDFSQIPNDGRWHEVIGGKHLVNPRTITVTPFVVAVVPTTTPEMKTLRPVIRPVLERF